MQEKSGIEWYIDHPKKVQNFLENLCHGKEIIIWEE